MHKLLDKFYKNQADVRFLEYIKEMQGRGPGDTYLRNKSLCVKNALGYRKKDVQFNDLCNSLINRGYLNESNYILAITEEGKNYLTDYHRFRESRFLNKFTKIFKENFSSILSVIATIISIMSLIISIYN